MALIPVDNEDDWLREAEACERLCNEMNAQIFERNKAVPSSERFQQISASIRVRLNQFNGQVKELRRKLSVSQSNLTTEEAERRLRQVEILESRRIRLQSEFMEVGRASAMARQELMASSSAWQDDNSAEGDREALLKGYNNEQLQAQTKRILKEQDEGLENLSKIISRQKDIAIRIHDEVQTQNELLDDIGDGMDGVDVRMREETARVRVVANTKPCLCGWYLLILGLIGLLILVIFLK